MDAGGIPPEARAAFAAVLRSAQRQRLSDADPAPALARPLSQVASAETTAACAADGSDASGEEAQHIPEGQEGANVAQPPGARRRERVPDEPTMAAALALPALPPALIEEAASSQPAPEPTEASAGDGMTVTAVSPTGATLPPVAMAASGVAANAPPSTEGVAETLTSPGGTSHEARRQAPATSDILAAADRESNLAVAAPVASALLRVEDGTAEDTPPLGELDPQATITTPVARREPVPSAPAAAQRPDGPDEVEGLAQAGAEVAPTGEHAAPPAAGAEGNGLARAVADGSASKLGGAVHQDGTISPDDGTISSDVEVAVSDGFSPIQETLTPSGRAQSGPDGALTAGDQPVTRPAASTEAGPSTAHAVKTEQPARRQQGEPAEGAPEALPGSARATVMQWLHGSKRVDEGQALQQAQRMVVSSLADDIRRLTFVGQDRALLQLQPPELGKLSIHLSMHEGGLSVEMTVETEAVKAIVESTLDQLQSALAQHGLATTDIFVGVGQNTDRDPEAWQARSGREPWAPAGGSRHAEAALPPTETPIVAFGSTVDYRI